MEMAFTVWGEAATKGAVRPVPIKTAGVITGSRLTEDSKRSRPWQALVKDAARQAVGSEVIPFPLETAVAVSLLFWLPAPKSIPKRRPSAPVGQRCDLDKLERGALDALTGVVWGDDGQVVQCTKWKAYAKPGTMPHVDFVIRAVDISVYPWRESQVQTALPVTPSLLAPRAVIEVEGV